MSRQQVITDRLIVETITNAAGGTPTISGLSSTETEVLNGVTAGTGTASKAVILDSGGDFIMPTTGLFGLSRGTLAATGSIASDAAVITQQVTAVTAANGTKAVALPAAATTVGPLLVINTVATTGATLPVFPTNGGNDNINAGAEDAAFTLGPGQAAWFIPTSATQWYVAAVSATTPTAAEFNILTGVTASAAELNYNDITTLGTGAASKAVVLDAGGDYVMPAAGLFGLSREALAATGSTAADAAVITQQITAVTGSNGTLAVALPAAATTVGPLLVINTVLTSGANLPVFPVNGGNDLINGGAEDAAFTLGPGKAAWFIPTSGTQWYVEDVSAVTATATEISAACDLSAQVMAPGGGISAGVGTLHKTSVVRQGDIIKTTIFLDLTGLASTVTDTDIIGTAGVCHLGQFTAAKNGTLFFGQVTCLETPAGGADDVAFYSATEATGEYDALVTDLTETVIYDKTSAAAAAAATQIALAALPAANEYLYLAAGEAAAGGTYSAGQFLLEFWGA